MANVKARLAQFSAVQVRPNLLVNIGVGLGKWATVPWIALLNSQVTETTQEGIYVVFLITRDLERVFLTLNQGATVLVNELGQREAQKRMLDVAAKARNTVSNLSDAGFTLDNNIALGGDGWRETSYETGTIAHVDFKTNELPDDETMNTLLEAALDAYDRVVDAPPADGSAPGAIQPYDMDDALDELFLEQAHIEYILKLWNEKKNLILHGAPGVGKSFVGKRLAYLLLNGKDESRIENVQFHQSCSYEDFIQGYKPTEEGGFERRDGVFYRFCEKAKLAPSHKHVFVIDEI
jgi:hypothetical protein